MREDGFNAGQRNIGRFFLFAIPLILGIAAAVWLGVWIGIHQWRHELSQQDRAAMYVGALERPKSKIKVNIENSGCLVVTSADLDGRVLMVYGVNHCHGSVYWVQSVYKGVSPNGTILSQDSGYCATPDKFGDKIECRLQVSDDDRIESIRVSMVQ